MTLSRRAFIVGSAAAGGGLAIGMRLPLATGSAEAQATNAGAEINAWVVVKPDESCVIRIARSEMGQGTLTGLAQLVAEVASERTQQILLAHLSLTNNAPALAAEACRDALRCVGRSGVVVQVAAQARISREALA